MENPQTWGRLEHAIADALDDHQKSMHDGRIGLSQVRMIADRLRAAGFIAEDQAEPAEEPPFNEDHHRYHTPRGPNPKCANCAYVNFHQPDDEGCECLGNGSCTC